MEFFDVSNGRPAPKEFLDRKMKRKDLKKDRKNFIQNMHRSHPETDWELMDKESRKKRFWEKLLSSDDE